ncbi:hypothetical protein PtA15_15A188 [Puccinia triticina]|uniref:Uncharacterized protein n=1 Tax=Puccinia triticina TaxID=208348 RepID=A0ABY7D638_9BASI|nr:uncharacterized protein PtA15_15A188 [Puccinia triticina]WAQ91796.1 hypothetical protein PtA15_15A188 [Puccinia triticina]
MGLMAGPETVDKSGFIQRPSIPFPINRPSGLHVCRPCYPLELFEADRRSAHLITNALQKESM